MSSPSNKPQNRIVIALDFGTTFSGVAYALDILGTKADVVCIRDWPGLEGERQSKVPTLIMYDENDSSTDDDNSSWDDSDFSADDEKESPGTIFKWGGQVHWSDPAVRGVKLLLDPDQDRPAYLPKVSFDESLNAFPRRPSDVARDFFQAIYNHAEERIQTAMSLAFYKSCQKDFVLSVPAVWSDKAKDLTLKAAEAAGIHPVTLIKEPEAAALYTLTTHRHTMKKHSAFLVCDAGGGTVDLTVYEIKEIEPRPKLSEIVPGQGGMFGSLGLNQRFEKKVRELIGEDQFAHLKEPDNNGTDAWSRALNEFDSHIKTAFRGDPESLYSVDFRKAKLQPNEAAGLYSNCWEFTGQVLQDIFEPLIQDILRLLDDQMQRARAIRGDQGIQAIFLVGGFGSSHYLRKRCEEVYAQQGIDVIQPHDAWGAIANGAVLSRLPDQATVVSTKAVRHYGTELWCFIKNEQDRARPMKYSPANGKWQVRKLRWFVHTGDILIRNQTIKIRVAKLFRAHNVKDDVTLTSSLYFSETPEAPMYPGPNSKLCCKLKTRIRGMTKDDLPKFEGPNRKIYYKLVYKLVICTASANLQFFVELKDEGMRNMTGKVEVAYT